MTMALENDDFDRQEFKQQIRDSQAPLEKMIKKIKRNDNKSYQRILPNLKNIKNSYATINEINKSEIKTLTKTSLIKLKIDDITEEIPKIQKKLPRRLSSSICSGKKFSPNEEFYYFSSFYNNFG
jgi:hypothetical protein